MLPLRRLAKPPNLKYVLSGMYPFVVLQKAKTPTAFSLSRVFIAFLISLVFTEVHAQEFAAVLIPAELKAGADAVIRSSDYDIEIKSPSHVIMRERHVITILTEHGDDMAEYRTHYNKMQVINSVEGRMYNAAGKEVKRFKKKEMTDRPVWDGISLMTDDRYKYAAFSSLEYPYTVVFEEEDEMFGIVGLHDWLPQTNRNASVQSARCTITAPRDYLVRYKMLHSEVKPEITEGKDKITYNWEVTNILPVMDEPFSSSWTATQPNLLIAPSAFEAAGYKGDMSTWNGYAKFLGDLAKGRDVLPDDIRAKVHSLTDQEPDPRKKVAILYDYLQKTTHYISVQLGIGGWQPFDAAYVSHNKYGDCKALSNYMKSLLKEAGITANMVFIRGGKNANWFQPEFPDNQFNHVICCVPLARDTVWLECTDQFLSAGYLSAFTSNRYGLLVTENGGQLIHTPDYALRENKQFRKISAEVDGEGNLKLQCTGSYLAERQDELESVIHHLSHAEQQSLLRREFNLPTYDVTHFDYQLSEEPGLPRMKELLDITSNGYAQVSGRRLFIDPDLLTRSEIRFASGEVRRRVLDFGETYSQEDSVEIIVPRGYSAESCPKDQDLRTAFGEYRTTIKITGTRITYRRYFEQHRGVFPATDCPQASGFYNSVYRSDRDRIVLVKNE